MAAHKNVAEHLAKRQKELRQSFEHWDKIKQDYEQLTNAIHTFPEKLRHDIMVPVGKRAFMPGKLIHTNEWTVLLGDGWFAEYSSKEALELVGRRMQHVELERSNIQAQLSHEQQNLLLKKELLDEQEGTVKLWEEYDENGQHIVSSSLPAYDTEKPVTEPLQSKAAPEKKKETNAKLSELGKKLDRLIELEAAGMLPEITNEEDVSNVLLKPVPQPTPTLKSPAQTPSSKAVHFAADSPPQVKPSITPSSDKSKPKTSALKKTGSSSSSPLSKTSSSTTSSSLSSPVPVKSAPKVPAVISSVVIERQPNATASDQLITVPTAISNYDSDDSDSDVHFQEIENEYYTARQRRSDLPSTGEIFPTTEAITLPVVQSSSSSEPTTPKVSLFKASRMKKS